MLGAGTVLLCVLGTRANGARQSYGAHVRDVDDASGDARLMQRGQSALTDRSRERRMRLPIVQKIPSPSWPFIFFHLRKSGGSALC